MKVMDELIELNEEHTPDYCGFAGKPGGLIMANKSWHCLSNRGAFRLSKCPRRHYFLHRLVLFGRLASIGLVIVDKEYKRLGLGRRMVNACISQTDESTAIRLCATKKVCRFMRKRVFKQRVQSKVQLSPFSTD